MREIVYYLEEDQILTEQEHCELELLVLDLARAGGHGLVYRFHDKGLTILESNPPRGFSDLPGSWIIGIDFGDAYEHALPPPLPPMPDLFRLVEERMVLPEPLRFGKPPRTLGHKGHQVRRQPVSRRIEAGWCR